MSDHHAMTEERRRQVVDELASVTGLPAAAVPDSGAALSHPAYPPDHPALVSPSPETRAARAPAGQGPMTEQRRREVVGQLGRAAGLPRRRPAPTPSASWGHC
jgi:hypothetical protein